MVGDEVTRSAGDSWTCRCGATDPAMEEEPERRAKEDDADDKGAALASRFVVESSRGLRGDIATGSETRLRRPLYLLTTHLRF
jgi:hypothetical protein